MYQEYIDYYDEYLYIIRILYSLVKYYSIGVTG